jgi:single-strand DNA-binding protein
MTNNFVFLVGRLTRDAEVRAGATGVVYADFCVAVNETFGDRKSTAFVNCTAFGRLAEAMAQHRKGEVIAVIGHLQFSGWTDRRTGFKRTKLSVIADRVLGEIAAGVAQTTGELPRV